MANTVYYKIIDTEKGTELHVSRDLKEIQKKDSDTLSKRLGWDYKGARGEVIATWLRELRRLGCIETCEKFLTKQEGQKTSQKSSKTGRNSEKSKRAKV